MSQGSETLSILRRSFVQFYSNPLRTLLTLLGVVFGVGAVVAMMSIGEGAQRQILARIESMGATSVHVQARPVTDSELSSLINDTQGLTRDDAQAIARALPEVEHVSYRVKHTLGVTDMPIAAHEVQVLGVSHGLFETHALNVQRGEPLSVLAHSRGERVAVLGDKLARQAFPGEDPIGKVIRLEYAYFTVVGVLESRGDQAAAPEEEGENGEKKKKSNGLLSAAGDDDAGGGGQSFDAQSYDDAVLIPFAALIAELSPEKAYNELDMISVKVGSTQQTLETKQKLSLLLEKLHGGHRDFEIIAPEEILRQKQETQAIFNAVLIAIAAISLLVGGIGVMNIMLANIMERVSEIGLRRAIGARKRDIRNQFLLESISICFVGGVIGVLLGIGTSLVVSEVSGLPMAFAWEPMALSFGISLMVGVTFGLMPAVRAANIDPIDALRGE